MIHWQYLSELIVQIDAKALLGSMAGWFFLKSSTIFKTSERDFSLNTLTADLISEVTLSSSKIISWP